MLGLRRAAVRKFVLAGCSGGGKEKAPRSGLIGEVSDPHISLYVLPSRGCCRDLEGVENFEGRGGVLVRFGRAPNPTITTIRSSREDAPTERRLPTRCWGDHWAISVPGTHYRTGMQRGMNSQMR
jgi:hypothetical protein